MTNLPTNQDGPSGAVTPPGQTHPHNNEGAQVSTITVTTPTDTAGGYQYLVGALTGVMTDEQIDLVLESCRKHAHEADFIDHAVRILQRYEGALCPECRGCGRHYLPDPDGWSARERREPEYETCDGCEGSGRVLR